MKQYLEQDFGSSESIEKQLEKIEKKNESLELVQKKETEIEDQTEEETLQKKRSTILDEKEAETQENFKDVRTFEEVDANRSTKPMIGRNPGLTNDIVDQPNGEQCGVVDYNKEKLIDHMRMVYERGKCDQCEVVVYDRKKLKDHIRMVHGKGHRDEKQVPECLRGEKRG